MTSPLSQLVLDIQAGLEKKEFWLAYHPIMNTLTRRVLGAEALLHWEHPKYGDLSSSSFLANVKPSASADILWKLSAFVMDTVCRDIAALPDQNKGSHPLPYVSFNIDPLYFTDPDLVKLLRHSCRKHGVSGNQLVMEVRETESSVQLLSMNEALNEIKNQGVRIAIDEFGAKFSSLTYLAGMDVDIIKLPGKLFGDVPVSRRASHVAAAIIGLLQKLKIEVIAEGIESESQLNWLSRHKVSCVQSGHLNKPDADLAVVLGLRHTDSA